MMDEEIISTSGLSFGRVQHYTEAELNPGDYRFIPGTDFNYVNGVAFRAAHDFFRWIKKLSDQHVLIDSVCNGAFALGHAGLLKDAECATQGVFDGKPITAHASDYEGISASFSKPLWIQKASEAHA